MKRARVWWTGRTAGFIVVAALAAAPLRARAAPPAVPLLVLQKEAASLAPFDPATGAPLGAPVPAAPVPHEMAATADGREVFITNYGVRTYRETAPGGNTLAVVDLARMQQVATVDLGPHRRPHGIARGASGRFYVTVDFPPALLVIEPARRAVVHRIPLAQKLPHMVVVTPDERQAVVASCGGSGTLTAVVLPGGPAQAPHELAIGGTPMGLALSADGRRLWAANRDGNAVVLVDVPAWRVARTIPVAGEPARPVLTPDERHVVVSALAGNAVAVVDTAAFKEVARFPVGERPEGIVIDAAGGRGFVSAQNADQVVVFSLDDWKVLSTIKTGAHPDALLLDRRIADAIDGNAAPLLSPERIAALPAPARAAWSAYLQRSARLAATDHAVVDAELRAAGKPRMTPAPYRKLFRLDDTLTPDFLRAEAGRRLAANVISFQTPAGGWSKHVDFTGGPRHPGESYYSENDGWHYIGTIDNDATVTELRFLALAYAATGDAAARAAFLRGLDYLLAAQFPNGGWPQVYPLQGGYHDAITFNDDAMINVMRLLDDVAAGRFPFVPAETTRSVAAARTRGVELIIAAQVHERGVPAIWAQQHDPLTLAPVPARSYEPAALAGRESAAIVAYLMSLTAPPPGAVAAVDAAVSFFRAHAIAGVAYDMKAGLRPAPAGAPPLWARLYELGTDRPLFSNRDGIKRYDWNELTDRRTGYAWYGTEPAAVLAAYPAWAAAHHPRGARHREQTPSPSVP